ncbi:MAG: hypothetical protein AAF766_21190 [Cyanobacteria bacterium P01_D01_bin.14]
MSQSLWDLAGIDGQAASIAVFGEAVSHLGPFQSFETELDGQACSVLRLCDRNFRIADAPTLAEHLQRLQANVWLRQFEWLSRVWLPADRLPDLTKAATVRPPHRIVGLPDRRAVPAQLAGVAVLLWHHDSAHPDLRKPVIECHVARQDIDRLLQHLPAEISSIAESPISR